MRKNDRIPAVGKNTLLKDALVEITQKGLGMTTIVDETRRVIGIFTDGDLRRALDKTIDIHSTPIYEVMTTNCKTITPGQLAVEAVKQMEDFKVNALPVVNNQDILIGALNMHDLLQAGVV